MQLRTKLAVLLLLLAAAAIAQRRFGGGFGGRGGGLPEREEGPRPVFPEHAEFHFVRLEYNDLPQFHRRFGFSSRAGRGEGWWMVDWPDAEDHFSTGVQRLTRVNTGAPIHFSLRDPQLFDHPWIYATQTGWWDLSDQEAAKLGEYLLRGGFLVVDDMWGPDPTQWEVFEQTMQRVLPDHPITDIGLGDSVMHVLYNIEQKDLTWIPGTRHLRRNGSGQFEAMQPPGTTPAWRAIYDNNNRMVVAVNYNTDIGDAWEYADAPEYPEKMTTLAYRYGINYLIYSMTH